jgi:signal transduction histidine kinase
VIAALPTGMARGDDRVRIPALLVGEPATLDGRPVTVLVLSQVADVLHNVTVMTVSVWAVVPLTVALVGVAVWLVVGSTLRPVASLRRGAAEIAHHTTDRRLPVPAAHDEIHGLAVTLNDMLGRLSAAGARQRAFTADAAHELRSPLASVRTQLEVALRHPDEVGWPAIARGVLDDVGRLTRLGEDLLALSRLDEGAPADPDAEADLPAVAAALAERYAAAPVPVTVDADDGVRALAPAADAERVLANLLDNAVRYAESGVTVTVSADGAYAVLTVTDDGPGIPPADRGRVFERFTRLDDARDRDAGGAGLGLAIVAETVRRYQGDVALGDAGPGLTATVRLPSRSG